MTFDEILKATALESEARQARDSLKTLKKKAKDMAPTRGFATSIRRRPFSVIAEVKTRSPSMGEIFPEKYAHLVHKVYEREPLVSAISVLTQNSNFGGSPERLRQVKRETRKPVLRKDFIWSEYEIYFSRCNGADAILLMTNVVKERSRFRDLHSLATELGMDVLCEVHSADELDLLPAEVKICGINSRKFMSNKRFFFSALARQVNHDVTIDLDAFALFHQLPSHSIKIAESGVTAENIKSVLEKYEFNAALIGTGILKENDVTVGRELGKIRARVDEVSSPESTHNSHRLGHPISA
ncbi:MAG TPA: indole-3-glycerol phosphate synthase TrpC [Candidatus Didemnitutus sp.]|nr:indole-3-glycerol phosphate synthase TrpC [Candidatus Didemnitutus sp.]